MMADIGWIANDQVKAFRRARRLHRGKVAEIDLEPTVSPEIARRIAIMRINFYSDRRLDLLPRKVPHQRRIERTRTDCRIQETNWHVFRYQSSRVRQKVRGKKRRGRELPEAVALFLSLANVQLILEDNSACFY